MSQYKSNSDNIFSNDELGKIICNSQFNLWYLLKNIYILLEGKKFRLILINELALLDLILENLEIENIKVIEFLLEFIIEILKQAETEYQTK